MSLQVHSCVLVPCPLPVLVLGKCVKVFIKCMKIVQDLCCISPKCSGSLIPVGLLVRPVGRSSEPRLPPLKAVPGCLGSSGRLRFLTHPNIPAWHPPCSQAGRSFESKKLCRGVRGGSTDTPGRPGLWIPCLGRCSGAGEEAGAQEAGHRPG